MVKMFEYLLVTAVGAALALFVANLATSKISESLQSSAALIANANS